MMMRTHLAQNQFITNSAPARTSVAADEAVASCAPKPTGASAALSNSGMPNPESAVASKAPPVQDATAAPIPASTGGPQEAPAGSAPNTAAPVGALVHWEGPWWLVLLEVLDLPPIELTEELPLFIRDGLHLRRWEA